MKNGFSTSISKQPMGGLQLWIGIVTAQWIIKHKWQCHMISESADREKLLLFPLDHKICAIQASNNNNKRDAHQLGAVTAISAAAAHLSKYLVLTPCLGCQSIKYARLDATIINRKTAADTKRIATTWSEIHPWITSRISVTWFFQQGQFSWKIPKLIKFYLNDG